MSVFSHNDPEIRQLVEYSKELRDLQAVSGLLAWDQETYLPPKGAFARAGQIETMAKIVHQKSTSSTLEKLLQTLAEKVTQNPGGYTVHDKALVKAMHRDFTLASKLPKKLVAELSRHSSLSLEAWKHARTQNSFAVFEKSLTLMVELKREVAYAYGFSHSPYDALLQEYEEDLTSLMVKRVFDTLVTRLTPLIAKLEHTTRGWDTAVFHQPYDTDLVWKVTVDVLEKLGFDLESGRQDQSTHPFTIGLSSQDVRVTTRLIADNPLSSILSSIHEGGHGMYEQGVSIDIAQTRLGMIDSLVLHESQSRFFENMIGKSKEFWEYFFPRLQAVFPKQLESVTHLQAWKEVNVIRPSLIRVDADEVSYHLHIVIRSEIERDLIEGTLKVSDVPERWKDLYKKYLGVDVTDDLHGSLQDIHWSQGMIGYFPTYSLGSFFSVQLFHTLEKHHPSVREDIAIGKFDKIHSWLAEEIHQHGRTFSSQEISMKLTGKDLGSEDFISYIENKFSL